MSLQVKARRRQKLGSVGSLFFAIGVSLFFCSTGQAQVQEITFYISGDPAYGRSFNDLDPTLLETAKNNYSTACENWKKEIRTVLGSQLKFITCGDKVEAWVSFFQGYGKPFNGLGRYVYSKGKISLSPVGESYPVGRVEAGTVIRGRLESFFDASNFSDVKNAAEKARQSYLRACSEWQEQTKKDFDSSFVLADCGTVIDLSTSKQFYFVSESGAILYKK